MAVLILKEPGRFEFEVEAPVEGVLLVANKYDTGWKAYLNDKEVPILRANYIMQAIIVPQGNSVVDFKYEPNRSALLLSLFAMSGSALIGVLLLGATWMSKRNVSKRPECLDGRMCVPE